jgi:hypothetical protein
MIDFEESKFPFKINHGRWQCVSNHISLVGPPPGLRK